MIHNNNLIFRVFVFSCIFFTASAALAVEIFFPPPRIATTEPYTAVSGYADPSSEVDWQHFRAEGAITDVVKTKPTGIFTLALELDPGINRIVVAGTLIEIYYDDGAQPVPSGFFSKRVHAGDISACDDCHSSFTMELHDGGYPQVCMSCHMVVSLNPTNDSDPMKYSHFSAVGAQCDNCHEPHISDHRKLLKDGGERPCAMCHEPFYGGEEGHPAYEEGGCSACHDSHFSGFEKNLHQERPALCQECHDQGVDSRPTKFHPPSAQQGDWCGECHNPHGHEAPLLRTDEDTLCASCHPIILAAGHGDELEECIMCHNPHKELGSGLLRSDFPAGCAECHEDYDKGKTVHPPVEDGCESCHNPHVDDNVAGAKRKCLECHQYDNDRELSQIHGNLVMDIIDCLNCHPPHVSKQDMLVKAKTHFPLSQAKCDACHGEDANASRFIEDVSPSCGKCHNVIKNLAVRNFAVHDPVESEGCTQCHNPHMSDNTAFLNDKMEKVCSECHDVVDKSDGKKLHTGLDEGCTACHFPHGGENKKFLTTETTEAVCMECHDDPAEEYKNKHDALDEGCTACHDPHSGYEGNALVSKTPGLCYDCHDDPTVEAKVVHDALDEGCIACHRPHGSNNPTLLSGKDNGVCLECHDDPGEEGEPHPALDEGCIACHNPHASKFGGLLNDDVDALCLECHDDPREGKKVVHDALDEGCTACHDPHVSKNGPLLGEEVNVICAQCHDDMSDHHDLDAVNAEDYPDGNFPTVGKELSCIGCHNPHASDEGGLFAEPEDTLCSSCH